MKQYRLELTDNQRLNSVTVLHTYHGPEIAAAARPGQFVNIRPSALSDPLLRRPFSICTVNSTAGTFTALIKEIGPGTRLLGGLAPGAMVDMLAPLGLAFQWEGAAAGGTMVLVAG